MSEDFGDDLDDLLLKMKEVDEDDFDDVDIPGMSAIESEDFTYPDEPEDTSSPPSRPAPVPVEVPRVEHVDDMKPSDPLPFRPVPLPSLEEKKKDREIYEDFDLGDDKVESVDLSVDEEELEKRPYDDIDPEEERRKEKALDAKRKRVKSLQKIVLIKEMKRRIRKSQNVDLVFLCDITGTMQGPINRVKKNCVKISNVVKKSFKRFSMRTAFIGYRDFEAKKGVKELPSKRFEVLPLGPVSKLHGFLEGVRASGGGDTAEDVFGGLEQVQSLDFNTDHPTRILIHLADAPCHGMEYHERKIDDYYPGGDPDGRDIRTLLGFVRDMYIHYFFIQITDPFSERITTKKMLRRFQPHYETEELKLIVFKESENYLAMFIKAINASIQSTISYAKFMAMGKLKKVESGKGTLGMPGDDDDSLFG